MTALVFRNKLLRKVGLSDLACTPSQLTPEFVLGKAKVIDPSHNLDAVSSLKLASRIWAWERLRICGSNWLKPSGLTPFICIRAVESWMTILHRGPSWAVSSCKALLESVELIGTTLLMVLSSLWSAKSSDHWRWITWSLMALLFNEIKAGATAIDQAT